MEGKNKIMMKINYWKQIIGMVIFACILFCGCSANTAGNVAGNNSESGVSKSAVSASGGAVDTNKGAVYSGGKMTEPVVLSEVSNPSIEDKKYGLKLPAVDDILREFEFLIYLDNRYMEGAAYADLKKREWLGVPLEVKVYCHCDFAEEYDDHCYNVLCEISAQGKENLYMMMTCNRIGFESSIYNPEYEWETLGEGDIREKEEKERYQYLGSGTAYVDEKAAQTFEAEWNCKKEMEKRLEKLKECVEKNCSEEKGKYRVYIDYFLPGDPAENGIIMSSDSHIGKEVYTLSTILLVHPAYKGEYDYMLRGNKKPRILHGSSGGGRPTGNYEKMKARCEKDYRRGAVEVWEFTVK